MALGLGFGIASARNKTIMAKIVKKPEVGKGHSYLAGGADVQAAGKLKLDKNGNVRRIDNQSGHLLLLQIMQIIINKFLRIRE
ncbi:hypothetical protein RVZ54_002098 [Listeria monocytogenes]|nr:hypothetical protein [Listeria monocytogenes]ELK8003516.1 hypothetical protein [Listeria monocytogenes]ELK8010870.1 hypothetical protein [Listeria monocytogenes]ELK8013751.1 hypothetical protein [Listeria monocytogenes]ELK8016614.1 hypothetical protein [Listeria monocytogenes]